MSRGWLLWLIFCENYLFLHQLHFSRNGRTFLPKCAPGYALGPLSPQFGERAIKSVEILWRKKGRTRRKMAKWLKNIAAAFWKNSSSQPLVQCKSMQRSNLFPARRQIAKHGKRQMEEGYISTHPPSIKMNLKGGKRNIFVR